MENNVQRKRKKRKRKSLFGRILKTLLVLAVIAGILTLVYLFGFRIKEVRVEGNSRYSDEEILAMVHLTEDTNNSLMYYWQNRNLVIENVPFIENISIEWGGRNTINIDVREKVMVGCIKIDSTYYYFDNEGCIVEISSEKQSDVLLVTGLTAEEYTVNAMMQSPTTPVVFSWLLTVKQEIERNKLDVTRIEINENGTMVLYTGRIKALLGKGEDLEDKITGIADLLPELEGKKGTLYLEDYNSTSDQIFFSEES